MVSSFANCRDARPPEGVAPWVRANATRVTSKLRHRSIRPHSICDAMARRQLEQEGGRCPRQLEWSGGARTPKRRGWGKIESLAASTHKAVANNPKALGWVRGVVNQSGLRHGYWRAACYVEVTYFTHAKTERCLSLRTLNAEFEDRERVFKAFQYWPHRLYFRL